MLVAKELDVSSMSVQCAKWNHFHRSHACKCTEGTEGTQIFGLEVEEMTVICILGVKPSSPLCKCWGIQMKAAKIIQYLSSIDSKSNNKFRPPKYDQPFRYHLYEHCQPYILIRFGSVQKQHSTVSNSNSSVPLPYPVYAARASQRSLII